ncbi:MAG TPA: acetylglutamate kinase, partial [Dehalococcoidia bacterium]|nr:acetylglutamate kinase [Dehalococcoidia bacterium]
AGLVNKQLVADLNALGARAWGLSGVDGALLATRQADPRLGFVGEPLRVNCSVLDLLHERGYLPVVAPVGFWDQEPSQLMNVNADTVAGEIAAALGVDELVFLTDVAYVRDAAGAAIPSLKAGEVEDLIAAGTASGGMIPKLRAGARAASAGARCYIVDGREAHALRAVLDGADSGTLVTA